MDGPKMKKQQPALRARVIGEEKKRPRPDTINQDALHRIRKAFDLAADSPYQREAAIRLAHKLMQKHNISRADVYEDAKTPEEKAKLGGKGVVRIERTDSRQSSTNTDSTPKRMNLLGWFSKVGWAISVVFDCKFYTTNFTKRGYIHFVFFGIAENATLAAESFEAAFNAALALGLTINGKKQDFYMGFGDGLRYNALKQRKREMEEVKNNEAKMKEQFEKNLKTKAIENEKIRRIEMLRLQGLLPSCEQKEVKIEESPGGEKDEDASSDPTNEKLKAELSDSDSESDDVLLKDNGLDQEFGDSEDEESSIGGGIPNEANIGTSAKHVEEDDSADAMANLEKEYDALLNNAERDAQDQNEGHWKNQQQLIIFRSNAAQIANDWKEQTALKLKKGRKSKAKVRDYDTYKEGKKHGIEHDVKRKRLEGTEHGNDEASVPDVKLIL